MWHCAILHRCHILYIVQKCLKVQLCKERLEHINLRAADCQRRLIKGYRHIERNLCQRLGQTKLLYRGCNVYSRLTANFIHIGNNRLYISPLLHELACPLLANARNARNIIRSIAPQRKNITYKHRVINAILILNRLSINNLDTIALLLVNLTICAHQLTVVLVWRNHIDLIARSRTLKGECSDNIISLVTLNLKNRDAHSLHNALDIWHRLYNILWSVRSVRLILREYLTAERAPRRVKSYTEQVRLLALLNIP